MNQFSVKYPHVSPWYELHHGCFASVYKYEIKYTSIPYSEGTMLYSFQILMPLNQIRSNTTSNQTLATRCSGSVDRCPAEISCGGL